MPSTTPSRKILLCISGMSPAIVTETLYALTQQTPPFVPDEVHIVTTLGGLQRIEADLLKAGSGHFHRFMRDYLPDQTIRFDSSTIHLITLSQPKSAPLGGINPFSGLIRSTEASSATNEAEETQLTDIITEEESRAAGDTIYRVMRQLKEVPGTQLHASVAGGRKSMTFYLGHAFSLLAEPHDKLSHVLVSEPFERVTGFFYPTRQSHMVPLRVGLGEKHHSANLDASQATVTLAELSVLRLGGLFNQHWPAKARQSFDLAVRLAQDALVPPEIHITLDSAGAGHIKVSGEDIELSSMQFVVFTVFALARKHATELPSDAALRLDDLSDAFWKTVATDMTSDRIGPGMNFSSVHSKIGNELHSRIGPVASHFKIEVTGKSSRGGGSPRMHQLNTDAQNIHFNIPTRWWEALRKELT